MLITISSQLLLIAFILYVIASVIYVLAVVGRRWSQRDPKEHLQRYGRVGYILTVAGFISQTGYVITRWIGSGHAPTSNMFEFIAFFSYCVVLAFLIIDRIYRLRVLGMFAVPLAFIMLAYASVFPKEVTPLIPALKSYWLYIHVTTAALGEGILAVGFAAGLMYLIRTVRQDRPSKSTLWLEITISAMLMLIAFILTVTIFAASGTKTVFEFPQYKADGTVERMQTVEYVLPAIVAPNEATIVQPGPLQPFFEAPVWMEGKDAARKLNTMIWSIFSGIVLYLLLRLVLRKRIAAAIQPTLQEIDPDLLDEISYRAIAIGYPIFTLGGLIFAMIWAEEAWGRLGLGPERSVGVDRVVVLQCLPPFTPVPRLDWHQISLDVCNWLRDYLDHPRGRQPGHCRIAFLCRGVVQRQYRKKSWFYNQLFGIYDAEPSA